MSAMDLLARSGVLAGAELCPHPDARLSCAILVQGGRHGMVLCPDCKDTLTSLIGRWHSRQVGAFEVAGQMLAIGYSRLDAARFILQLTVDRFKVKAGLLREADL